MWRIDFSRMAVCSSKLDREMPVVDLTADSEEDTFIDSQKRHRDSLRENSKTDTKGREDKFWKISKENCSRKNCIEVAPVKSEAKSRQAKLFQPRRENSSLHKSK